MSIKSVPGGKRASWVKRQVDRFRGWQQTQVGKIVTGIIVTILVFTIAWISGDVGYHLGSPITTEPQISLVQNVVFSPVACSKVPDVNAPFWNPKSYWLCLAKQDGKPADFYDRDEGTKNDSSNIATNINTAPPGTMFSIIASGMRNTALSEYPNILCLFTDLQHAEPPSCDGYPNATTTQQ